MSTERQCAIVSFCKVALQRFFKLCSPLMDKHRRAETMSQKDIMNGTTSTLHLHPCHFVSCTENSWKQDVLPRQQIHFLKKTGLCFSNKISQLDIPIWTMLDFTRVLMTSKIMSSHYLRYLFGYHQIARAQRQIRFRIKRLSLSPVKPSNENVNLAKKNTRKLSS